MGSISQPKHQCFIDIVLLVPKIRSQKCSENGLRKSPLGSHSRRDCSQISCLQQSPAFAEHPPPVVDIICKQVPLMSLGAPFLSNESLSHSSSINSKLAFFNCILWRECSCSVELHLLLWGQIIWSNIGPPEVGGRERGWRVEIYKRPFITVMTRWQSKLCEFVNGHFLDIPIMVSFYIFTWCVFFILHTGMLYLMSLFSKI